jgi:hypothetical protein
MPSQSSRMQPQDAVIIVNKKMKPIPTPGVSLKKNSRDFSSRPKHLLIRLGNPDVLDDTPKDVRRQDEDDKHKGGERC